MATDTRPTPRQMIASAIRSFGEILTDLSVMDLSGDDADVLRRVGWLLVNSGDEQAFCCGRRLLDKAANGRLHAPPHKRWWPGPGKRTADLEATLNPYSIELAWRDGRPRWEIGGRLWLHGVDHDWRWYPLLHVDAHAEWARTQICWIRLGKRMQHAV